MNVSPAQSNSTSPSTAASRAQTAGTPAASSSPSSRRLPGRACSVTKVFASAEESSREAMQECDITSTIAEHDFHVDSPRVEPLERPRRSWWACFQVSASGVTHRWADVGGLSVHVAEAGAGPPLLLLHASATLVLLAPRRAVAVRPSPERCAPPRIRKGAVGDRPPDAARHPRASTESGSSATTGVAGPGLAWLRTPERFRAFLALGIVHPFQRATLLKRREHGVAAISSL